jgi:ribonuclease HI
MSFVSRELEKLSRALQSEPQGNHYAELYAAQQALSWAMEPQGFKAPLVMIMGTQQGSEGCQAYRNRPQSSDTFGQACSPQ